MKEVRLESTPERMNRISLPDAPGQGVPLVRGDIPEGSLAISLCFSPWAQEQYEMSRSGIGENELECRAE